MKEHKKTLRDIECRIKMMKPKDVDSLMLIKADSTLHEGRLADQQRGKVHYLGAMVGGRAVGFVLLVYENKQNVAAYTAGAPCADMVDLYVMDPLRGLGIGSLLITAAEDVCRQKGFTYLGLDVNPADNPQALRLYERLGYQVIGELHLDNTYPSIDEEGNESVYEDWCLDMIKKIG